MTTDTSAEALAEIKALEYETNQAALTLGEIGLRGMCIEASKRLRKLWKSMEDARDAVPHLPNARNEKRRAREGVTETANAIVRDVCETEIPNVDDPDTVAITVSELKLIVERNLEAVWPDGRDANVNYKPCARVCNGEVHAYMDETDEGKYVAIVLVDADGHPLGGSSKCTSTSPEGARGQSLKRTGEHAPNSIPATQDTDHD